MSIAGYFDKSGELRMPRGKNRLGIHSEDPVMTGQKSAEQARREDAIRALTDQLTTGKSVEGGSYSRVEDYDPVLRFHCRL